MKTIALQILTFFNIIYLLGAELSLSLYIYVCVYACVCERVGVRDCAYVITNIKI